MYPTFSCVFFVVFKVHPFSWSAKRMQFVLKPCKNNKKTNPCVGETHPPSDGAAVWSKGFAGAPEPASSGFASLFDPRRTKSRFGSGYTNPSRVEINKLPDILLLGKEQTTSGTSRQRLKKIGFEAFFPDDFFVRGIAVFFSGQVLCHFDSNTRERKDTSLAFPNWKICDFLWGKMGKASFAPNYQRGHEIAP